ncbi:MAG TPA: alpha/beta hydrolase [Acidimicrobiales bacterium]|nr:alpha/beta hydrolase [Acidimicrobiales bacterium]
MTVTMVRSSLARLACDLGGPAGDPRPPVLLLHPGVGDLRCWHRIAAEVAGTHRPISFDRRGYGSTTCEPEAFSHVDDAVAVLDAAGAGPAAVVVGNSMGGRVAVELALAHPDRVAGLVLIAPSVRGARYDEPLSAAVKRLEDAIDAAEEAGDLDQVNKLEAWLWLDGPDQPEGRVGGGARALFLDMNGTALAAPDPGPEIEAEAGGTPAWDRLDQIGVPALVTVGELDLPDVRQRTEETARRLAGSRFVVLPGVAHLPQVEGSEVLTRELRSFLGEVAPG